MNYISIVPSLSFYLTSNDRNRCEQALPTGTSILWEMNMKSEESQRELGMQITTRRVQTGELGQQVFLSIARLSCDCGKERD